jgi:hypothetical protein
MNTVNPTQRTIHCHTFLLSSDPIPTHLLNNNSKRHPYQLIMNSSIIPYNIADVLNVLKGKGKAIPVPGHGGP